MVMTFCGGMPHPLSKIELIKNCKRLRIYPAPFSCTRKRANSFWVCIASVPTTASQSRTTSKPWRRISPPSASRRIFPPHHETIEKAHGRLEIRRIWTSTEINEYVEFPCCSQVACLEWYSEDLKAGKTRHETAYLITSLSPTKATPQRLLALNRGHWDIENRSYYVRDVTFDEDRSQIRSRSGPRMMVTLRNFAISILRLTGIENIAKALRTMAAKPHLALRLIGI